MRKGENIKTDRQVQQCSVLLSGCENFGMSTVPL